MNEPMKGLPVYIYRDGTRYSSKAPEFFTEKFNRAILIGRGVEGPFDPDEQAPALILVTRHLYSTRIKDFRDYLHAEPLETHGKQHHMFGGNFIHTSDSRFPSDYPIPVHDRIER